MEMPTPQSHFSHFWGMRVNLNPSPSPSLRDSLVLFCSVTRADWGQGRLPVPRSHLWCRWLGVLHWGGKALWVTNTLWDNWNQERKVFSNSSSPKSWDVAPTPKPNTGWPLHSQSPADLSFLSVPSVCLSFSLSSCLRMVEDVMSVCSLL